MPFEKSFWPTGEEKDVKKVGEIYEIKMRFYGSSGWTRTSDLVVNSHMLYQLSYRGT